MPSVPAEQHDEGVQKIVRDWTAMQNRNPFDPPQPFNQQTAPNGQPSTPPMAQQGNFQQQPANFQQQPGNFQQPANFQQEPPKKNWFLRHKFLTAILAIVALIIVINIGSGGDDTPAKSTAEQGAAKTETEGSSEKEEPAAQKTETSKEAEEPQEQEEPAGFKIGDTAQAGDMTYVVKKVKTGKTVGSGFLEEEAKGKYVIVTVEVTNNSTEAAMVTTSFFKLKSGEKTFEADSGASISATNEVDESSFFAEELNPDLTMTGVVVFDVSDKVAEAKDNILQAQTGFWGTQTVDILLAK